MSSDLPPIVTAALGESLPGKESKWTMGHLLTRVEEAPAIKALAFATHGKARRHSGTGITDLSSSSSSASGAARGKGSGDVQGGPGVGSGRGDVRVGQGGGGGLKRARGGGIAQGSVRSIALAAAMTHYLNTGKPMDKRRVVAGIRDLEKVQSELEEEGAEEEEEEDGEGGEGG